MKQLGVLVSANQHDPNRHLRPVTVEDIQGCFGRYQRIEWTRIWDMLVDKGVNPSGMMSMISAREDLFERVQKGNGKPWEFGKLGNSGPIMIKIKRIGNG